MELDEEERRRRDEADVVAIDRLLNNDEFVGYFLRRLEERRGALSREILANDKLSHEDRETKRLIWKEIGHIMEMPRRDRASIRKALRD